MATIIQFPTQRREAAPNNPHPGGTAVVIPFPAKRRIPQPEPQRAAPEPLAENCEGITPELLARIGNMFLEIPGVGRFLVAGLVPAPAPPAPEQPQEQGQRAQIAPREAEQARAPLAPRSNKDKREAHRKDMIAKVNIALKGNKKKGVPGLYQTLDGFSEDAYRYAMYERWGVTSITDMSNEQLHDLLLYLADLGFKAKSRRKFTTREDRIDTIKDLLADKAHAEGGDISLGYAVGILKRQTKNTVISLDKATPAQLDDVIAALRRNAQVRARRNR